MVTKISEKIVKSLSRIPVNKMLLIEREEIDSGNIILPSEAEGAIPAGKTMLLVTAVAKDCKKVKIGDYIITQPNIPLGVFKVLDKECLFVKEENVAVVLRMDKKSEETQTDKT